MLGFLTSSTTKVAPMVFISTDTELAGPEIKEEPVSIAAVHPS